MKIFPKNFKGTRDFQTERFNNERLSRCGSVVKAVECIENGLVINQPDFPEKFKSGNYSFILMPKHKNGTLIDFLLRANNVREKTG